MNKVASGAACWRKVAVGALLIIVAASGSPTFAQQRSLSGFRYIIVSMPEYRDGGVDSFGFGRLLQEELRRAGWTILDGVDAIAGDRQRVSQTLLCTIDHNTGSEAGSTVTITFYDVVWNQVHAIHTSSIWDFPVGVTRAVSGAVKELRKTRPSFAASMTVDIIEYMPNVVQVETTREGMDSYLARQGGSLAPIEGVWAAEDNNYVLGIYSSETASAVPAFAAVVLDSNHLYWDPGMLKAWFFATASSNTFRADYLTGSHERVSATASLNGALLSIPIEVSGQTEIVTFVKIAPPDPGAVGDDPEKLLPRDTFTGTAFVAAPGVVATNYHVIENGARWVVSFPTTGETFDLELLLADRANDLALLSMLSSPADAVPPPLKIADSSAASLGGDVYTLGFPLGQLLGASHKVATGVLGAMVGLDGDPRMYQITVPSQPGNSGGPLMNSDGAVIGVFTSTLGVEYLYEAMGHIPQNVNFALKSDYLLLLLRQAGLNPTEPAVLDLSSLAREEQVDVIRASVGEITSRSSAPDPLSNDVETPASRDRGQPTIQGTWTLQGTLDFHDCYTLIPAPDRPARATVTQAGDRVSVSITAPLGRTETKRTYMGSVRADGTIDASFEGEKTRCTLGGTMKPGGADLVEQCEFNQFRACSATWHWIGNRAGG